MDSFNIWVYQNYTYALVFIFVFPPHEQIFIRYSQNKHKDIHVCPKSSVNFKRYWNVCWWFDSSKSNAFDIFLKFSLLKILGYTFFLMLSFINYFLFIYLIQLYFSSLQPHAVPFFYSLVVNWLLEGNNLLFIYLWQIYYLSQKLSSFVLWVIWSLRWISLRNFALLLALWFIKIRSSFRAEQNWLAG